MPNWVKNVLNIQEVLSMKMAGGYMKGIFKIVVRKPIKFMLIAGVLI